MRTLGLVCVVGLCALSACAQGSVLTPLSASVFSGGTYTGGSLDGNTSGIGDSDVLLVGTGFSSNVGQQMFAAIVDGSTNHLLTQQAGFSLIDAGGNFQMSWKNLVVPGQNLYVAFFADVNGNAFCNAIPTDNGWEVSLTTRNDGTVISVSPDVTQRSVCDLFGTYSATFDSGNAMTGHGYPGHTAYGAVIDLQDKSLVGEVQAGHISASGGLTMSWPGLLEDHHRYIMALCVDTAGNGTCDSAAEYTFQAGPVSSDTTFNFAGATLAQPQTFETYWPQNVTLPPAAAAAIPFLGGT